MSTLKGPELHMNVFRILYRGLSCTWTCLDNRSLQCVPLAMYEILYEKNTEFCEIPQAISHGIWKRWKYEKHTEFLGDAIPWTPN